MTTLTYPRPASPMKGEEQLNELERCTPSYCSIRKPERRSGPVLPPCVRGYRPKMTDVLGSSSRQMRLRPPRAEDAKAE